MENYAARVLTGMDRRLVLWTQNQVFAVAVISIGLIGYLDHITGYEFSVSLLYLAPIVLAAWYIGIGAGAAISLAACVSGFLADAGAGRPLHEPIVELWNSGVRFGFFVTFAAGGRALRATLVQANRLARTDSLTGLFNRRVFWERLERDLDTAKRNRGPLSILYVDLDNFKVLNDRQGHAEGDEALRVVAQVAREIIARRVDTVARLGGDEFAMILPSTDASGLEQVVKQLRQRLRAEFDARRWPLDTSIGAVTFLEAPMAADEALHEADALMYDVKRQGKGCASFKVVGPSEAATPKGLPVAA